MTNLKQCMKCYCLYVLRWQMKPILALNCLLQIKQESSDGDALALAFHWACFCLALLILSASYSPAPLLIMPCNFAQSCAICSHDWVGMLKSLKGSFDWSLYHFFWPPREHFWFSIFFGKRSSGILVTWPILIVSISEEYVHCILAFFRTSVSDILSCLLIFKSFLRQLVWKWFSLLACHWSNVHMHLIVLAAPQICRLLCHLNPFWSQILPRSGKMLHWLLQSWHWLHHQCTQLFTMCFQGRWTCLPLAIVDFSLWW